MTLLAAVIPAAGLSSRMGRFKPLLPLGDGVVLEHVISLFTPFCSGRVIVVTGKRGDEVAQVVQRAGAVAVHNPGYEQGMYSSVLAGIGALPDNVDGFFMLPADIPLVRRETVSRLVQEFDRGRPSVLYPRFRGERGHPPVICRDVLPDIRRHDGTGGLRAVLDRLEADACDLEVADSGILHDLDHPEEYAHAVDHFGREYPDAEECAQLWTMVGGTGHVMRHCEAVTRVAETLCAALNRRGAEKPLDLGLVRGAALTHDIGKGTKRHESVGAALLHTHGFHAAADIVGAHFDVALSPEAPISENEVVFLADKLVRCHKPIPLRARYVEKMEQYASEPGAVPAIQGRLERAEELLARFDRETGISAEALAKEALA